MRKSVLNGFTLVELSLSMAFIGILSIAIVAIINSTMASYRRGLTLNQVNSIGMDIADDMRAALTNSTSKSLKKTCEKMKTDGTLTSKLGNCGDAVLKRMTYRVTNKKVELADGTPVGNDVPVYGAFCTGSYSYIWNSGYYSMEGVKIDDVEDSKDWATFRYSNGPSSTVLIRGDLDGYYGSTGGLEVDVGGETGSDKRPFRLLKVWDEGRFVCITADDSSNEFEAIVRPMKADETPVDLILADSNNDLAMYELYSAPVLESVTRMNSFYSLAFILGTTKGGANINVAGNNCTPPNDEMDYDYCAINKFNFAVQTAGE